jgi:carbonic anhydrase
MQKLIQGIHRFQQENFRPLQGLFEQLSKGQNPETLFITCSDSRIDPNLLTRSQPGDLFILRNAGNIVPPHGAGSGGEAATIEFAVAALGVKDIVICGHSHCGAMRGLLQPEQVASLPAVTPRLKRGDLHLHGWVYKIETGEVFAYDLTCGQFVPVAQYHHPPSEDAVRHRDKATI